MRVSNIIRHFISRFIFSLSKNKNITLNSSPKKILVVTYDAIGDFILSTPALKKIILQYPDSKITLLCSHRNEVIAKNLEYIENYIAITLNTKLFSIEMWKKILQVKNSQFDLIKNLFDEADEVALAKIAFISNGKLTSLPIRNKNKEQQRVIPLFNKCVSKYYTPLNNHMHFTHRMLSIIPNRSFEKIEYDMPTNHDHPWENERGYIIFTPHGSQKGNSLSVELSEKIKLALKETGKKIYVFSKNHSVNNDVFYISPKTILHAASIIKNADLIVTTDTSIEHISVALNKPFLVLRNNESWRDQFSPLYGKFIELRATDDDINSIDIKKIKSSINKLLTN